MKVKNIFCYIISPLAFLFAAIVFSAEERPNILLIHVDDVGFGDYTTYNPESKIKTPEIDRIAQTGIRFNSAHTPAALCAPTRYALLTGNYPWRGRHAGGTWGFHSETQFKKGQKTFGHFLQKAGYNTAIFGKLNLGFVYEKMLAPNKPDFTSKLAEGPLQWGFDYSFVIARGHQSPPYAFYENNTLVGDPAKITTLEQGRKQNGSVIPSTGAGLPDWNTVEVGRQLTEKAVAFIDRHLAKNKSDGKNRPFLIHFNTDGAHGPYTPPKELFGRQLAGETKMTAHTDMVLETDIIVGQFVKVLKERGLYKNTVIVITSDNGGIPNERNQYGHDAVGGLRGRKSNIWEGGHRVPFIVHWGDDTANGSKIKPNSTSNQIIGTHDLAATFAEIAGIEIDKDQALDSISILPILLGKQDETKPLREYLLVQSSPGRDTKEEKIPDELKQKFKNRPQPLKAYNASKVKVAIDEGFDGIGHAIIKDGWKLFLGLTDKPEFLVNLNEDPQEKTNLLEKPENKKRVDQYTEIYKKIRQSDRSTPTLKVNKKD
jgi:arylsulfatase A-like enzyme